MWKSITETLKKINIELKGPSFLSIILSLLIINIFVGYKVYSSQFSFENESLIYGFSNTLAQNPKDKFIYASKRGTKYYYFNCKSSIKEENKIYFNTEESAISAGYSLAKTCK